MVAAVAVASDDAIGVSDLNRLKGPVVAGNIVEGPDEPLTQVAAGLLERGRIAGPVPPIGGHPPRHIDGPLLAAPGFVQFDVLVVFHAVPEPLQAHGRTDAVDADLFARIEQHALSRIAGRIPGDVVPRIGCPKVSLPVKEAGHVEALVREARLYPEVDRREVDLPFGRVVVLYEAVVGPGLIALLPDIGHPRCGGIVHLRQQHPDVHRRPARPRAVIV